jgi:hypothetical protein
MTPTPHMAADVKMLLRRDARAAISTCSGLVPTSPRRLSLAVRAGAPYTQTPDARRPRRDPGFPMRRHGACPVLGRPGCIRPAWRRATLGTVGRTPTTTGAESEEPPPRRPVRPDQTPTRTARHAGRDRGSTGGARSAQQRPTPGATGAQAGRRAAAPVRQAPAVRRRYTKRLPVIGRIRRPAAHGF